MATLRRHVMHGIITPVIGRTSLAGGDGCLLLLPIWGILRQTGGNDPSGFVFIYTGEVKRRQDMHCLEPAFRQGAKMSHAVGVLVVKGLIQPAMSRWNREVIYAEVADMQLVQTQIAGNFSARAEVSSSQLAGFVSSDSRSCDPALGSVQCDVDGIWIASDIRIHRAVGKAPTPSRCRVILALPAGFSVCDPDAIVFVHWHDGEWRGIGFVVENLKRDILRGGAHSFSFMAQFSSSGQSCQSVSPW